MRAVTAPLWAAGWCRRSMPCAGTAICAMSLPAHRWIGCRRMEIFPDKRNLVGLVEQACEGKICLPNFQRDFVWTREEVADLIRSIVRGYFIGSLLLLRCDAA